VITTYHRAMKLNRLNQWLPPIIGLQSWTDSISDYNLS